MRYCLWLFNSKFWTKKNVSLMVSPEGDIPIEPGWRCVAAGSYDACHAAKRLLHGH